VRLDITTEDRQVDMVEEGYDLVIRINPDPDESLIGRVFLRDRLVVVGSSKMSAVPDGGRVPAVTRGSRSGPDRWTLTTPGGERVLEVEPVLGMSSLLMVRDAAIAGIGIACLPLSLVSPDLASGRLTLWGEVGGPDIELWLLYPSRRLLSARVAAFLEFFRETFPEGTPEELSAFRSF
jgi:DNA-binding transcriptional LysR family regulator